VQILRDLRRGIFDVLVGINLLREGLDLPEVSLVAILDADKEGFLRATTSLIQTVGRASRNVEGRVIMYADRVTESMRRTIDETERRRAAQQTYNERHAITPRSVVRKIVDFDGALDELDERGQPRHGESARDGKDAAVELDDIPKLIERLREDMNAAADRLEFERAAELRDQIKLLSNRELLLRDPGTAREASRVARGQSRRRKSPRRRMGPRR
jgi:excinuclease ABC subunit B